jgi:hypothetical protein
VLYEEIDRYCGTAKSLNLHSYRMLPGATWRCFNCGLYIRVAISACTVGGRDNWVAAKSLQELDDMTAVVRVVEG